MVWFLLDLGGDHDTCPRRPMNLLIPGYRVSVADTQSGLAVDQCPVSAIRLTAIVDAMQPAGDATTVGAQTMLEFAFILPLFLLLMLGVIQMVLIGGAALAVNQAAVTCSRYAALNPNYNATQINTYLSTIASPLIKDNGLKPVTVSPSSVPRATGSAVSVTVTYDLKTKLILGATFFGVTFPAQVSVTHTVTSE